MSKEIHRHGGPSSSSAYKLIKMDTRKMTDKEKRELKLISPKSKKTTCPDDKSFQKSGQTYIKQIGYERKLKKPLTEDTFSRPTSWGIFLEHRAFTMIPELEYQLVSKTRYEHQEIKGWTGMPDLIKSKVVGDIKCPYSLESFCDKIAALQDIETYKEEFPEDYWQLISNACLLESNGVPVTHMEAVIYCPYYSELADIQLESTIYDDPNLVYWIANALASELPHLLDDCEYDNLNQFTFEIPQEDKDFLTTRVEQAIKLLKL